MSVSRVVTNRPSQSAPMLHGKIVFPQHASFDEARRAWNLAVDQRPAAVVYAESSADVVAAVMFAEEQGLRLAPQGTGHNAAPLGSLEDAILLKTERMRRVQIDPVARIARVEAGAVWLEVVEAAAEHGLAALAGSSPDVGVVGYTLGGGVSWLGRKHGLAATHVEALELVTADGRFLRTDANHEPGLFWALRGGGGSFGVVTAIEIRLLPITEVYAGILWYPIERGGEVLHAWRDLTQDELPDELTTVGRYLQLPPIPEIPEPLRGKSFVIVEAVHAGDPLQADALLAPLRSLGPVNDTIATISLPALSHMHMDPEQAVPGAGDGLTLAALPDSAVERVVSIAGAGSGSPLLSLEIRHLGGELGRTRPANGALASIEAEYLMYAVGMTPTPEAQGSVTAHVEAVKRAVDPWAASHVYLNFAETSQAASALWSEQAYRRLQRIKNDYDPYDVFRSNHPVRPHR